jgi:hypothetical protein
MIKLKAGLHDWEMNLIQGMVSQLQIDYKALQTSNKTKKNQINTTYKMMEVSVKLCDQLLGFENIQPVKTGELLICSHYSCQFVAVPRHVFYIICRMIYLIHHLPLQLSYLFFLYTLPYVINLVLLIYLI